MIYIFYSQPSSV